MRSTIERLRRIQLLLIALTALALIGVFTPAAGAIPGDGSCLPLCEAEPIEPAPAPVPSDEFGDVPAAFTLTLEVVGTGIVRSDAGTCFATTCTYGVPRNATISFSAEQVVIGSTTYPPFAGWSGSCTSSPCTVTMYGNRLVRARFAEPSSTGTKRDPLEAWRVITVRKAGEGSGTVRAEPGGIVCGADCSRKYEEGDRIVLVANAHAGSHFVGWSEPCGSQPKCLLPVGVVDTVTATFQPVAVPATILPIALPVTATIVTLVPATPPAPAPATPQTPAAPVTPTAPAAQDAFWNRPSAALDDPEADDPDEQEEADAVYEISRGAADVRVLRIGRIRWAYVRLELQRAAVAEVTISRRGRRLAHARLRLDPGIKFFKLRIPRAIVRGRAAMAVKLTDGHGRTQLLDGSVVIPR
jgi:hypothetical protein